MTIGGIIAVGFLLVLVVLVLWNIRGHRGFSDRDHHGGWHGPGGD